MFSDIKKLFDHGSELKEIVYVVYFSTWKGSDTIIHIHTEYISSHNNNYKVSPDKYHLLG